MRRTRLYSLFIFTVYYSLFTVHCSLFTVHYRNTARENSPGGALKQEQTPTNGASSLDRHFARYGLTVGVEVEDVEAGSQRGGVEAQAVLTRLTGTAVEQFYAATGQVHDFRGSTSAWRSRVYWISVACPKGFGAFWSEPLRTGPSAMPVPRRNGVHAVAITEGIGTDHHAGADVEPALGRIGMRRIQSAGRIRGAVAEVPEDRRRQGRRASRSGRPWSACPAWSNPDRRRTAACNGSARRRWCTRCRCSPKRW